MDTYEQKLTVDYVLPDILDLFKNNNIFLTTEQVKLVRFKLIKMVNEFNSTINLYIKYRFANKWFEEIKQEMKVDSEPIKDHYYLVTVYENIPFGIDTYPYITKYTYTMKFNALKKVEKLIDDFMKVKLRPFQKLKGINYWTNGDVEIQIEELISQD